MKNNKNIKHLIVISLVSFISLAFVKNVTDLTPNLTNNNNNFKGVDISHYNKVYDWDEVKTNSKFVIIKSTEGGKFIDPKFSSNWKNAKKNGIIRGAYHFFSPKISAEKQFLNFKNTVKLLPGDLPPILDVELKEIDMNEVNKWLKLAEEYYGVKPIIYSDYFIFKVFMDGKVDNYKLWIHINEKYHVKPSFNNYDCIMWQYSHTGKIPGIKGDVDLNEYLSDSSSFYSLLK